MPQQDSEEYHAQSLNEMIDGYLEGQAQVPKAPGGVPFERVALTPRATRLVGATASTLSILQIAKGGGTLVETVSATGHAGLTALSLGAGGRRCLSAGSDGRLRLWRVDDEGDDGGMGSL